MSVEEYINIHFKRGPLSTAPSWDGNTSRLKLFARSVYTPQEAALPIPAFQNLNLDLSFWFTDSHKGRKIDEEMGLILTSPLGAISKGLIFPADGVITLSILDVDTTTIAPGQLLAYASPIYAMRPKLKMEV